MCVVVQSAKTQLNLNGSEVYLYTIQTTQLKIVKSVYVVILFECSKRQHANGIV